MQHDRRSPAIVGLASAIGIAVGCVHSRPLLAQSVMPPPKAQEAGAALQRGDLDQAILLYNNALEDAAVSNDRRAVLLTERGVALMKRRNYKLALDDFNKAATIYPEYPAVYVNRGNLLLVLNQGAETIKEAIKDFDRAIELSPKYAKRLSQLRRSPQVSG